MDFIYDIIDKELKEAKDSIVSNMKSNGKYVSGKSASLVTVEGTNLLAPVWIDTLENGRKEGKLPYNIKEILIQWGKSKGLSFDSESDLNRWTFLTAKKIREFGTKQYRDSNYKDIYSSVIEDTANSLKESIEDSFTDYIINTIKE